MNLIDDLVLFGAGRPFGMGNPDFFARAIENDGMGCSMTDYADFSAGLWIRAIAKACPDLSIPQEIYDSVDHGPSYACARKSKRIGAN